ASEAAAPTDGVAAEPDLVLEEPEALLRVAAVIKAVRPEVQDLTLDGSIERHFTQVRIDFAVSVKVTGAVRTTSGRNSTRERIPCCVVMQQVVLVRQAARPVLPCPLVDVLWVFRTSASEYRGVGVRFAHEADRGRPTRVALGDGDTVGIDLAPIVGRRRL